MAGLGPALQFAFTSLPFCMWPCPKPQWFFAEHLIAAELQRRSFKHCFKLWVPGALSCHSQPVVTQELAPNGLYPLRQEGKYLAALLKPPLWPEEHRY